MKHITKIYAIITILLTIVIVIPLLMSITVVKNKKDLDMYMNSYVKNDTYKNIHIYDSSCTPIYDKGFSDDEVIRKSMFHIVGDRYGSLPKSLLTENCDKEKNNNNKLFGYSPTDTVINLTIDLQLQKAAYLTLENSGYNGCIVVIDYLTGEIKAMVSFPTVDVYNTEYIQDGAFLNKALLTYPPGSVFKAVTVAAALESNPSVKNYKYNCSGVQNHIVCHNKTVHGQVDLNKALEVSCNCAISNLAKMSLTPDMLDKYTEKFKLTSSDIIADMDIAKGSIDSSDDLMWAANGQSKDMVSPISMAMFYGAIANNGIIRQLKIKQDTDNLATEQIISSSTASTLTEAMTSLCRDAGIRCAAFGKTGTAQLDLSESHAWFVCSLVDKNAPTYAIVTFLEQGGKSYVAKKITATYINNYVLNGIGT